MTSSPPRLRAADFDERLGRGLAEVHALGAANFGAEPLYIGPLAMAVTGEHWPATYAALLERLEPGRAVRTVIERLRRPLRAARTTRALARRPVERQCDDRARRHAVRVELFQLLPLLVHARLFGGGYGAAAERAARRYR